MFTIEGNEVRVTKEMILAKVSQETLMSHYLNIPVKKGIFINPLRNDKKPTASFYRNNKGDLIFKDFGNNFSGNFISVVMEIFKCSFYKALKIVATDFDLIPQEKGYEKHVPKIEYQNEPFTEKHSTSVIQIEAQEFSKKELDWWQGFGISLGTLNKFKVKSCKSIFLNGQYFSSSSPSSPMYGYYGGKKDEVELWRIYMPTKRTFRFLSNWSSSRWQGMSQIDKEASHCILTKSMKDVMTLNEFGFNSIAPTSETILISENRFNKLSSHYNKNILLFFDNDLAGVYAAKKYKNEYNCKCIFLKRRYAKDVSDFYKKHSISQFWELVEELNEIINNNINQSKYFYIFNNGIHQKN